MSFFARPVARRRLRSGNPVYTRVAIALSPSEVRLQFDQRPPMVTPIGGTPVDWTRETGEVFAVSTRLAAGRLVQTFVGREGRRENVYALGADRRTLTVAVTVSSPRLPRALLYTLVYRRAGALAPAADAGGGAQ